MTQTTKTNSNILDRVVLAIAGHFGNKSKEVERFIKFAIVGSFGAIVDFMVLNLLQATILPPSGTNEGLHVALATGTAFTSAVVSNFIWNRYWTFPDSRTRSWRTQLTQFFIISLFGLIFRLLFVSATYAPFGDFADGILNIAENNKSRNQLGSNIAQAISIGIVLFWNYFANRYWTYNDVDQQPQG